MKTIVSRDNIIFKYFLFSLVIPQDKKIDYVFFNFQHNNNSLPWRIVLGIKPEDYSLVLPFSFFSKVMHYLTRVKLYNDIRGFDFKNCDPLFILFWQKDVRVFLEDLKSNNYQVDDQIKQFKNLLDAPKPLELISGTKEWQKDRYKLMIRVILVFTIVFILLPLVSDYQGTWQALVEDRLWLAWAAVFLIMFVVLALDYFIHKLTHRK